MLAFIEERYFSSKILRACMVKILKQCVNYEHCSTYKIESSLIVELVGVELVVDSWSIRNVLDVFLQPQGKHTRLKMVTPGGK